MLSPGRSQNVGNGRVRSKYTRIVCKLNLLSLGKSSLYHWSISSKIPISSNPWAIVLLPTPLEFGAYAQLSG